MTPGASRSLTDRQIEVMQRIDRRLPIKLIARDLDVSETRVNQHIRALKDIYQVSNLGDLVTEYRAEQAEAAGTIKKNADAADHSGSSEPKIPQLDQAPATILKGEEAPPYSFSQVPGGAFGLDNGERDEAGRVEMHDVMPMLERAPWLRPGEPKVVPGVLDGEHAVLFRFAAIIGIAFGFLAAVVLTVTAAITISEALDERADIPVDERGFA